MSESATLQKYRVSPNRMFPNTHEENSLTMELIPKSPEEWKSCLATAIKGGALITDVLFTRGMVQFLVGKAYEIRANKAIEELKDISIALKAEIQKKISIDYIKSHEFLVFVSNTIREAVSLKNLEKLKYFRSAIISGMVRQDLEEGRKLLFVDCLSSLSVDSLILLKTIHDMYSPNRAASLTFEHIQQQSGYEDSHYLMANLKTLERYHLIEITVPQIKVKDYGNYAIIYGKFGKDFISFILDYS